MTEPASWPPRLVSSLRRNLDEYAEFVRACGDADTLQHLTRLLVIRSSGFLEQTSFEIARGYVEFRSGGMVRTFASSWLERTRNPSEANLMELVGRFDESLKLDFETFLHANDDLLSRELSFLVDRRNKIAHGLNENLNRQKALTLKGVSVTIADWFINHLDPSIKKAL
jgi:hypothetical protein